MMKINETRINLIYKIIAFIIIIIMGCFLSAAPTIAAESTTKKITITKKWVNDDDSVRPNNITINLKKSVSTLKTGTNVKSTMTNIAGNSSNITKILKADRTQYEAAGSPTSNDISSNGEPVYVWYDSGIIYYYSEADNIYMNSDSSSMFSNLPNLTDISGLSGFNATYVTNMFKLFNDSYSLENLSPIADWDVGNVTTMRFAFGAGYTGPTGTARPMSINSVSALSNWKTQKVTDMGLMFKGCLQLTDISPISGWNVSNLANVNQMLFRCGISDATCIKDWDVVRVGGTYFNSATGSNATGSFSQMFTHQNDVQNQQPTVEPFTNRAGSWSNGTYTATTGATSGSAPTTTKVNDANQYTSSSSNCTVTKNGDTWTYEFEVSNDESIWYAWETTNNGKLDDKNGYVGAYQESSGGTNGLGGSEANAITGIGPRNNNSATITNTNTKRKEITVKKQWANDSTTLRPSNTTDVNLHLKKGNTDVAKTNDDTTKWIVNNSGNEWTYTFNVYNDDNITDYSISEDTILHYTSSGATSVIQDPTNQYKGTATITNTLKRYSIVLNKRVTGNMADTGKTFDFDINVYDWNGNLSSDYSTTASLAHGQSTSINDIPEGYTYTITENGTDYTESYKIENTDDNTVITEETQGLSVTGTLNENQTITFKNNKEKAPATAAIMDIQPFLVLLIITIILGTIYKKFNFYQKK